MTRHRTSKRHPTHIFRVVHTPKDSWQHDDLAAGMTVAETRKTINRWWAEIDRPTKIKSVERVCGQP